jgi:feruloyl esterase
MERASLLASASAFATTAATALGALAIASTPQAALAQPAPAAPASDACAALTASGLFDQTAVGSARMVAADAAKGTPAFCEVTATISPAAGSTIGVVYRLPEGWNGKLLGLGGGGWAGNVRIEEASEGLKRGYATLQTDGGHATTGPWDTAWASNPESVTDFAWRAIHMMTVVGKEVAAKYYGKAQTRTYYQGCSTGGRQGLMEVQRFPDDYDGVITGAPVYNLLVQTTAVVRNETFNSAGDGFTEEQLSLVNKAVLAACDAQDGLADGIVTDPRACGWDPAELQCKPGAAAGSCLTDAQVNALRTLYRGVQEIDGRTVAWPLSKGSELGWSRFISISGSKGDPTNGGGLGGLRGPILGDPNFDLSKFNPDSDLARVMSSSFAKAYNADNPAIGDFTARGGKLLMWHGWYDPGPSAVGTIRYYDHVRGSVPGAQDSVRLFLAPGVYHCGGGPGPDRMDLLGAIDAWVQTGKAPETLLATKAGAKISRPLCPYPAMPHFKGSGDPDDAASFECR